jgi:hypothetical protein
VRQAPRRPINARLWNSGEFSLHWMRASKQAAMSRRCISRRIDATAKCNSGANSSLARVRRDVAIVLTAESGQHVIWWRAGVDDMLPLNVWNLSCIGCQWCAELAQRRQHTFHGSEVAAPTHGGKHLQTYLAQEIGEAHDEYAPDPSG